MLFAVIAAALAIGPLLLWRAGEADAIRADFDLGLTEQMELLLRQRVAGEEPDLGFPAWQVNSIDEWVDPMSDTDIEPPLITWARDVDDWPEFRNYSQDGEPFRGYVLPFGDGQTFVTLTWAESLDDDLGGLNRRTMLWALGLLGVSAALGWLGAGLALGPAKRLTDGQQGFLADAAHEMRTPLAVIMASSSQALNRDRSSEEYVRSLSEIRSAAERASTGVNELLDLVRFDSGQAIPRLAPLRLDLLAEEVAASIRADESSVSAEPGEAIIVNADMALVRQALDNVVRNATRRASKVELTSRVEARYGVVAIRDNGPGFDPDTLPRVFDRYHRGDQRGEVGVGLAIVKAIVEANGGEVTASNADDGGAIVTIRIPLSDR